MLARLTTVEYQGIIDHDWMQMFSDYDWDFVEALKKRIPSTGRKWFPKPKGYWIIRREHKAKLLALLAGCGYTVKDATLPLPSTIPLSSEIEQAFKDAWEQWEPWREEH